MNLRVLIDKSFKETPKKGITKALKRKEGYWLKINEIVKEGDLFNCFGKTIRGSVPVSHWAWGKTIKELRKDGLGYKYNFYRKGS